MQQALVISFQSFKKLIFKEEDIQIIIQHWIRISNIKLGWINNFDKLVVDYATTFFMLDTFSSSSKLIKTFIGHTDWVNSIDYSTFNGCQSICSGSDDKTVRLWDVNDGKQIKSFNEHSEYVYCVKFSQYHYHNNRRTVICSASRDKTIRFWDFKNSQQMQMYNGHTGGVNGIEFSSFNGGRYLCSGSDDNTVCLWDIETSKSLHVFNGHEYGVECVDISPMQSNNNNSNSIGVIGGNGYTICSGSCDNTIRIWDIETTKILITLKGHIYSVCVRLWDIRSGKQIQVFTKHQSHVYSVEYSPFVVNNIEIGDNSNVICSGSTDNIIRFWDIRSSKKELYLIKGDKKDAGIRALKFIPLKTKKKKSTDNRNIGCDINLCYGSLGGLIHIWG
ncbi:WD-40 repeat protein [Reticulomyxa filosa]|uniref:WD-40 repeat protein n=1 Tax=Reticulomyxa filosa TaxID=46433 RepID=X6MZ18_RETFI|nr:WD-40 repeat protein [Reticulomyxa filosa]|eukprot:ETO18739.1 WD-40 repeat protein [Reticulomyxa filosa]